MRDFLFRCSSLGRLMTEPKSKSEVLSVGAKTYIRQLVAQEVFAFEPQLDVRPAQKGIEVEDLCIAMVGRRYGLELSKNFERRHNGLITGEADITYPGAGRDIKASWSLATFPIVAEDCKDSLYEWQMRGYMMLWDVDCWHVDYCMVSTPEHLIGWEDPALHHVDYIPEAQRITTWTVTRDAAKEAAIREKVPAAREYMREVMRQFDVEHA
jgi:hypothetical protein